MKSLAFCVSVTMPECSGADTDHDGRLPVSAQLESLQAESEADAAKRMKQEEELRQDVADALEGFGAGKLDAEGLLAELCDLGIDAECSAEQLTLLARCGVRIVAMCLLQGHP